MSTNQYFNLDFFIIKMKNLSSPRTPHIHKNSNRSLSDQSKILYAPCLILGLKTYAHICRIQSTTGFLSLHRSVLVLRVRLRDAVA